VCIEEFPLVQGERERYGDLFQVVLVDVDERDAGLDGFLGSLVLPKAGKILQNLELDWPNTIIDGGPARRSASSTVAVTPSSSTPRHRARRRPSAAAWAAVDQ
jgi:hypothetical protein